MNTPLEVLAPNPPTAAVSSTFVNEAGPTAAVVSATMRATRIDEHASPDERIEATVAAASSPSIVDRLQPLPVARSAESGSDLVVVDRLGEGGMGIVELARQETLGREVAIKRLHGEEQDPSILHMLLDEARTHGSLEHPNIAPIHALGVDDELGPIVVMKRVVGSTWREELARDREKLPGDAAVLERHLGILMQVCNALHFAHSRGIVHRDVKTENVMVGDFGEVYLMDWGIALDKNAKHGRASGAAGTPTYMAPEMVVGDVERIDARSDVYLLGATLHEVLVGKPRHYRENVHAVLFHAVESLPETYDSSVPPDLGAICNRACHADPDLRFQTPEEMRRAILDHLDLRDARRLVDAASELIDEPGEPAPYEASMQRLREASFALTQALEARPGLRSAMREQVRCTTAMLRTELDHDNVRAAEALARTLGDDLPAELGEALEAKKRARTQKDERLRAFERDIDPEIARRDRLRVAVIALVCMTALNVVALVTNPTPGLDISPFRVWLFGAGPAPLALFVVFLFRKRLRATRVDRDFVRLAVGWALLLMIGRSWGYLLDQSLLTTLTREMLVFAGMLFAMPSPIQSRLSLAAAFVAGTFACAIEPQLTRYVHLGLFYATMVVIVIELRWGKTSAATA